MIEISDTIWDFAETGLQEHKSAAYLIEQLQNNGFKIENGMADMKTAFTATYGTEGPVIAILGEFDALPGLSQEPVPHQKAITQGANGHGCNHNLLGTAGIAAVLAIKKEIDEGNIKGTIRYYGCPAEETYNAKGWMVIKGLFDDVDIALTWHPFDFNGTWDFSTNAMNSVMFSFHGKTAHAAGDPYNGRSALDGVELMNVGANYLREHIIPDARLHYVIKSGGEAPNVVPAFAESHYFVRAPKRYQVDELYERVVKVAKGAAMMTETEVKIDFLSATYNTRENSVIRDIYNRNMAELGSPKWDDDDYKFAEEMYKTHPKNAFDTLMHMVPTDLKEEFNQHKDKVLCDFIIPNYGNKMVLTGSTDVADVSWKVPLAQFSTATTVMGAPGHSWQATSCGRMSIGHKGMILAAKILAITAMDFFSDPELTQRAKDEFNQEEEIYKSPFPEGHKPPYHRLTEDKLQTIE